MKNIKIIFMLTLILVLSCTISFATVETKITAVAITGIDYPYSTGSVLDTDAEVSSASQSIVSKVAWSMSANDLHVVTITLRPNINCYYSSDDVVATVNGNVATNTKINEKGYLEISYEFPKDGSVSDPNSANTLRHHIYITYSRHGVIEPKDISILDGQSVTVKITPNEGYEIRDVIVDGDSVGAISEYTFRKVKETHTIKACYNEIKVQIDEDKDIAETKEDGIIYLIIKSLINLILK